jgi:hypothetical protein
MQAYKEDDTYTRIAVLETITSKTEQTLLRIENKIDDGFTKIDDKFAENTQKFDNFDEKLENVRKENTSHFRTTIFTLLTLIGTPLFVKSIELLTKFLGGT